MIALWVGILIIALAVLVVGANALTRSAERLGKRMHISPFIIGVTIVAIGTSLPELVTSIVAVVKNTPLEDTTQIVVGNAIGSNIANILLIGGLAAVVARVLVIKRTLIDIDLPLLLLSAVLLWFLVGDGEITFVESLILVVSYLIYFRYTISSHGKDSLKENIEPAIHPSEQKKHSWMNIIMGLTLGAVGLYIGAEYAVRSVIELAELLGFTTSTLSLTVVAIGTSLPEVTVSVMAALRKSSEVAIGNIIGSNIFNTFMVIGIPGLFTTLVVAPEVISLAMPAMLFATLLFTISNLTKRIYVYEGAFFLLIYGVFIGKLFNLF